MKDKFGYTYWKEYAIASIEDMHVTGDIDQFINEDNIELHQTIFNPPDFIMIYTYDCLEWLETARNMDECIETVLEWDFETFGNMEEEIKKLKDKPYYHRDQKDSLIFRLWDMVETLSSVERLVARYAYILGEEIIYNDLDLIDLYNEVEE